MSMRQPPSPHTSALQSKLAREEQQQPAHSAQHTPTPPQQQQQLTQPFLLVSFPRQGTDWFMGARPFCLAPPLACPFVRAQ
jgi:hypothetical protein